MRNPQARRSAPGRPAGRPGDRLRVPGDVRRPRGDRPGRAPRGRRRAAPVRCRRAGGLPRRGCRRVGPRGRAGRTVRLVVRPSRDHRQDALGEVRHRPLPAARARPHPGRRPAAGRHRGGAARRHARPVPVLVVGRRAVRPAACQGWGPAICDDEFVVDRVAWAGGVRMGLTPLVDARLQTERRPNPFMTSLDLADMPLLGALVWPEDVWRLDSEAGSVAIAGTPGQPVWYLRVLDGARGRAWTGRFAGCSSPSRTCGCSPTGDPTARPARPGATAGDRRAGAGRAPRGRRHQVAWVVGIVLPVVLLVSAVAAGLAGPTRGDPTEPGTHGGPCDRAGRGVAQASPTAVPCRAPTRAASSSPPWPRTSRCCRSRTRRPGSTSSPRGRSPSPATSTEVGPYPPCAAAGGDTRGDLGPLCVRHARLDALPDGGDAGPHMDLTIAVGARMPAAFERLGGEGRPVPIVLVGRYGPRLEPCHPTIYECNGSLLVERVTWADGEPFDPGPVFDAGLEVPAYDMASEPRFGRDPRHRRVGDHPHRGARPSIDRRRDRPECRPGARDAKAARAPRLVRARPRDRL